jgi:ABC-2 type transport system permease protein
LKILWLSWKNIREQVRDLVTLGLSLVIGPFFVLLYWLMIPSGSTTFTVLVQNLDQGQHGRQVIQLLEDLSYPSGDPLLDVIEIDTQQEAETLLKNRDAELLITLPDVFSATMETASTGEQTAPVEVIIVGDLTNPYYAVGAVMAGSVIDEYVQMQTGEGRIVGYNEIALGDSAGRSEFDIYIPGILIISIVMLVFIVSMTIASEIESGTLKRLKLSGMKTYQLLVGMSLPTILWGIISLLLTLLVAVGLGFDSQGSILLAILVGALTSIAVVGVGLIVAAFSKSVSQAFILANFPLIFFMFFSGAVYPIPRISLFSIGELQISIYDILPPTHAVVALNKILSLGAGLSEVTYELVSLTFLTLVFYGIGIWAFDKKHIKTVR